MKLKKFISKLLSSIIPIDKNTISFESLNDLDCNSGALYDYLLEHKLNDSYKIIWQMKDMSNVPKEKIKNVSFMPLENKSIKDKLKIRRAKFLIWDNVPIEKTNSKQISIYLSHGSPVIKNVKGILNVPKNTDYVVLSSHNIVDTMKYQFSIPDETKIIFSGYPRNDYLLKPNNELKKVTKQKYKKVIVWMPTFRKAKNSERNDSTSTFKFGIPIIKEESEFEKLNELLKEKNMLLIIKIHGGQDLKVVKIKEKSNIKLITSDIEKKKNIHLYKLLANIDCLITDYSTISFDFLLTNKPIGYTIDDIDDYKIGFAYPDIFKMMPGMKIKNYKELLKFFSNIASNKDGFKQKRKKVLNEINEFKDDKNRERIIEKIKELT